MTICLFKSLEHVASTELNKSVLFVTYIIHVHEHVNPSDSHEFSISFYLQWIPNSLLPTGLPTARWFRRLTGAWIHSVQLVVHKHVGDVICVSSTWLSIGPSVCMYVCKCIFVCGNVCVFVNVDSLIPQNLWAIKDVIKLLTRNKKYPYWVGGMPL